MSELPGQTDWLTPAPVEPENVRIMKVDYITTLDDRHTGGVIAVFYQVEGKSTLLIFRDFASLSEAAVEELSRYTKERNSERTDHPDPG